MTSFDSSAMEDDEEASRILKFFDDFKNDDKNHGEVSKILIDDGAENDEGSGEMIKKVLDVEAYALLYRGRTKITRLLFIADRCNNVRLQLDALRLAYNELKNGKDTKLFKYVVSKISGRLGPDYGPNDAWADPIDRQTEKRKAQLEKELKFYRTNLMRDHIKSGYQRLGDFYYERGLFHNALYCYMRMGEYCTISGEVIDMCLSTILCKLETGDYKRVTNSVNKALQYQDSLDNITLSRLSCAIGLSNLDLQNYKQAAIEFLKVDSKLGMEYTQVISPQDIATYGGLCALASFNEIELKINVIDNIHFNRFLDSIPEMRELIRNFYNRSFEICIEYLENVKGKLLLDIHLHKHVETLYDQISNKAALCSDNVDQISNKAAKPSTDNIDDQTTENINDLSAPELEKQDTYMINNLDDFLKLGLFPLI